MVRIHIPDPLLLLETFQESGCVRHRTITVEGADHAQTLAFSIKFDAAGGALAIAGDIGNLIDVGQIVAEFGP
jgi:hypothetical protein